MRTTIQQLEDLKEWSQDSTRYERRLAFRGSMGTEAGTIPPEFDELSPQEQQYYQNPPFSTHPDFLGAKGGSAQLVQPGPGRQGYNGEPKVKPVLYKIKSPHHTETGKWAYKRSDNPIMYFNTKKEAEYAKKVSKILQYESMEKPTTGVFQKKVKKFLDQGLTKKQTAKNLGVNFKVVDRAIEEGNIKWKFEPYINVPKNLNYVKKNYGKLSRETMAKNLFSNEPLSTSSSRIGKLSQKLFDTGELKPTRVPTKEHAKKHGYYKDPEHEIVARVKKAKRDAVKARSVESIETAYSGTKKTQLSHMDDIYSQFTTGETLGYAPGKINQEFLKPYDNKMKSLYKKRDRLLKEKPKDLIKQLEQINKTGARLAGETGGYKSFKFVDPYTLKPYQFGVEASKTIDPLGILEGKTIQEASIPASPTAKRSKRILDLSPEDKYFFEKNRKAVLASQKKVTKDFNSFKKGMYQEAQSNGIGDNCTLKGVKKAEGGRIGFASGTQSFDECMRGAIADETRIAKSGKGKLAKRAVQRLVGVSKWAGKWIGLIDVPLEFAFALPALLRGDIEGAKRHTTFGLFGWGETQMEQMKETNPEAYKFLKHDNDVMNWQQAEWQLGNLNEAKERLEKMTSKNVSGYGSSQLGEINTQIEELLAKQTNIEENYIGYEYTDEVALGKQMLGSYVKNEADRHREARDRGEVLGMQKPIVDEAFGELTPTSVMPEKERKAVDYPDTYGGYLMKKQFDKTEGRYREDPIIEALIEEGPYMEVDEWRKRYMPEKSAISPAQLNAMYGSGAIQDYYNTVQSAQGSPGFNYAGFAGGGIAGIRRPWAIPPESGPMPQGGGLSSQYNRVKKLTE